MGTAGFFYDRYGAVACKFGATSLGSATGSSGCSASTLRATTLSSHRLLLRVGPRSGYLDCAAIGSGVRAFPRRRGCCGLLKSFSLASSIISGRGAVVIRVNFIVALAVFAGGLPLLALCKFEDVADRAPEGDAVDAVAAGVLSSLSMRVVGFALLALCIAVLRVIRPPSALGFNVAFSLVIAVGLAWIVRAAARARPASFVFSGRWRLPLRNTPRGGTSARTASSRTGRRTKRTRTSRRPRLQSTTRGPARRWARRATGSSSSPSCRALGWAS